MKIVSSEVPLYDNHLKKMVMAALVEDVEQWRIEETGLLWKLRRQQLGLWSDIQHEHWDWGLKSRTFPWCQTFAIEYRREIQGLLLVNTASYSAKLSPDWDEPILYVSFLESAPHNVYGQHFKYVGKQLYLAAIQHSIDTGCEGRVGLYSLPDVEVFYEKKCGMTRLEEYRSHEGLVYFESTRIQSREILKRK